MRFIKLPYFISQPHSEKFRPAARGLADRADDEENADWTVLLNSTFLDIQIIF